MGTAALYWVFRKVKGNDKYIDSGNSKCKDRDMRNV